MTVISDDRCTHLRHRLPHPRRPVLQAVWTGNRAPREAAKAMTGLIIAATLLLAGCADAISRLAGLF